MPAAFILLSTCVFVSLIIGFTSGTALSEPSSTQKKSGHTLVPSKTDDENVTSIQDGVWLLEHILQRMRSLPQLAISKTKQAIAFQSQAQPTINEPIFCDSSLLIKPKDLSRAQNKPSSGTGTGFIASANYKGQVADEVTYGSTEEKDAKSLAQPSIWERSEYERNQAKCLPHLQSAPNVWFANRRDLISQSNEVSAAGPGTLRQEESRPEGARQEQSRRIICTSPLITEFQAAGKKSVIGGIAGEMTPQDRESTPRSKSAKQGRGRFAFVPNTMIIDKRQPTTTATVPSPPPGSSGDSRGMQRLAQTLSLDSFAKHVRDAESASNIGDGFSAALSSPPQNRLPASEAGRFATTRFDSSRLKSQGDDLFTALLPPTVITGVPLVRLGSSEKEVIKCIGALGQLHKQSVHDWSIWSLRKPHCSECAIQVFVRHGVVDAIRIFDRSLLRPDLCVTLGDRLSVVKEKFGEPAFILTDSSTITRQNYIYPISQIGFQLSRVKEDEQPKIVSMIVFNVR